MRTKKTYSVNPIRCLTVWKSGLHHGYLLQAYIPIRAYQENGIEGKLTSTMKNDSQKNQPSLESFAPTEIEALSFPILSLIRHSRKDCGDISGEALWRRIQATFGPSKTKWSKSLKRTYIPSNSSPCIHMCHTCAFPSPRPRTSTRGMTALQQLLLANLVCMSGVMSSNTPLKMWEPM